MKDPADSRTADLLSRFVERGQAAQRAVDDLAAGKVVRPKRGVSTNAAKSASKPERKGP